MRIKNARVMKSKRFRLDVISEITGLPLSEIAELWSNLKGSIPNDPSCVLMRRRAGVFCAIKYE